jgi:ATP-dependent DNA helicase RecQ
MPARPIEREVDWAEVRAVALERFGVERFRDGQRELVEAALTGRDALGILPTGAGKSLCFQLPSLLLDGATVVVSPLIALMQDQTDKLAGREIEAARLDSTLRAEEEAAAEKAIARGQTGIVYLTPERLSSAESLEPLRAQGVALLVVDEAHCVSQWGHDFRPAYLEIRRAIERLGSPPVMALTATSPPRVTEDIVRELGLRSPRVVATGVERPNLFFEVLDCRTQGSKRSHAERLLAAAGGAAIVYCTTIRITNEVHAWLRGRGVDAERYHGKLSAPAREAAQRRFMSGEAPVMVATSAFGMGIDKPDIRLVVHWNFPDSVETYYQEAGRAGRDGAPARAVLFYRPADKRIQSWFLGGKYPKRVDLHSAWMMLARAMPRAVPVADVGEVCGIGTRHARVVCALLERMGVAARRGGKVRKLREFPTPDDWESFLTTYERRHRGDEERLAAMIRYAQTALCRVRYVREYFGEDPGAPCGQCDNCRDRPELVMRAIRSQEAAAAAP